MIIYLCHTVKFILSHSDSLRSNCGDLGTCWRKLQLMIVDGDSATLSGSLKYCKACHGSAYSTKNKTRYENCSLIYALKEKVCVCVKTHSQCLFSTNVQYSCYNTLHIVSTVTARLAWCIPLIPSAAPDKYNISA